MANLKDWVLDGGTILSYTNQAGGNNYNNTTSPTANMYDINFDTYSERYTGGAGAHYEAGTLVATFPQAVHLTDLKFKKYCSADGNFGQHQIWVYDGSWTLVYADIGNGSQTEIITITGSWKNITKIQFSVRAYANDPVAWTMTVRFYEAQAWGPLKGNYTFIS